MAAIDAGGGNSGKKSVNQEIPLIPFIDLLLCCVMFLLATAVWNQLAAVNANQQVPGQASTEDAPPEDEKVKLILYTNRTNFTYECIKSWVNSASNERRFGIRVQIRFLGYLWTFLHIYLIFAFLSIYDC